MSEPLMCGGCYESRHAQCVGSGCDCECVTAPHSEDRIEEKHYDSGCECDSCARLYELAVMFGIDGSCTTADEVAANIKHIHEGMTEALHEFWAKEGLAGRADRGTDNAEDSRG